MKFLRAQQSCLSAENYGSRGQIMAERSGSIADRRTNVFVNGSETDRLLPSGTSFRYRHFCCCFGNIEKRLLTAKQRRNLCIKRSIVAGMLGLSVISVFFTLGILVNGRLTADTDSNYVGNYFERPENNRFQLNVLPEYEVERYVFPAVLPNSVDEIVDDGPETTDNTILYRIPAGPKSPRAVGKRPSLIQHGILCDTEPCTVNKLQVAIVYLLVDQGYDVWLGLSNSSMAENSISSERIERKRLEYVAKCILSATNQTELLVMAYFNGSSQFFGMSAPPVATEQSKLSKWLEYIPGVKTAKKLYHKGRNYLTRSYDKVIESFDSLGKKVDYIIDDPSITTLKNTVLKAWGIVVTMVVPTLEIKDYSKMINHPDVHLDVPQLITKYGYYAESHIVRTEDGYLLSVHRISGSSKHPPKHGKPVVYLQHGILASSAVWVLMGPSKSLGYLLADAGYDVWMGNSRGNSYSRGHLTLSISDTKFWDFSFHEMGVYDLPACIEYILAQTGQEKINYVGHSQGTTSFFVMLSEKPQFNDKIIKFAAYAPIVYATHVRSPIIDLFGRMSTPIYYAVQFLNIHDFLPTNALLTKIGREICEARTLYQVICSNALFMVTGYDSAQMNKTTVPIIMGHLPAGGSVKQFLHFAQEFNSRKFRNFDYYTARKNRAMYSQAEPPEYKIENMKVPTAIFYAANDWLADPRDIEKLARELPHLEMLYKVPMELFNHIDFMFAIDAPALIYQPTIEYLKRPITPKKQ